MRKVARLAAQHLLAESEVSIAVVAELAGFSDASYLSVAFRREAGESPYAYRARHRTSQSAEPRV
jgi:AraC-like DNA-binding protein